MPDILLDYLINKDPAKCYSQFKGEFKAPYIYRQIMNAELKVQIAEKQVNNKQYPTDTTNV